MKKSVFLSRFLILLFIGLGLTLLVNAQKAPKPAAKAAEEPVVPETFLDGLKWRCIGPANMGGRIDDFAVVESDPHVFYVATASAGLWKTTNNGVTFAPVFDDQTTSTIGDVTVSQSNPDIVWVGTGEPNNRQSSSWGDGVYKSADGGKTWKNMGLRDTHHIGRIVIHPTNPDVVYVAALGHLWDANKERGLFKTTDGGKTWINTKFIDENSGFVDVAMDPENPNTLYAAAYQRRRAPWGFNGGGPGSGLYKTTDGGETWIKLTKGLPEGPLGRIGIDIYQKNPSIIYLSLEGKATGTYRSDDKGDTWRMMSNYNNRPMYYSQIRIDPANDQRIYSLGAPMGYSEDGGKTFRTDLVRGIHGDHHAMWINPANSDHMLVGSDGGIHISYDRGVTWDFINTIPLGQFYEVAFDMRKPYWVYGGLQDNGSWGGPSATFTSVGITNDEWIRFGGGDGFYAQVDPTDHTAIYGESQDGNVFRFDLRTGETKNIRPQPDDPKERYRFNWNSPILISPYNSKMVYYGGNRLFISRDRGDTWEVTADLTANQDRDKMRIMGLAGTEITFSRNDGVAFYGTITTVSESPLRAGVLWIGTDDGFLQVSRDGGKAWKNVGAKVTGVPKGTYVSRVEASHFEERTCYVAFDGHRSGDFKPYVFATADFGETWTNISAGIPEGSTLSVVREHPKNANLLFVGTERGAFFSIDKGAHWTRMKGNLPIVPVDDIQVHPRDNDLIFATHGRSVYVLDSIFSLQHLTKDVVKAPAYLFDIRPATIFSPYSHKASLGSKFFVAPNPPYGAIIDYSLSGEPKGDVKLVVQDAAGNFVQEIAGTKNIGINRVAWNLRYAQPGAAPEGPPARGFAAAAQGPAVLPGEYRVMLKADGQEMTKTVKVEGDPRIEVSFEARKAQHDALLAIYKLQPTLTAIETTVSALSRQLSELQGTLGKMTGVPAAVLDAVKAVAKDVSAIQVENASVRGQLTAVNRAIASPTGTVPTAKQFQQIQDASGKLKPMIEKANTIIDVEWPRLNKLMNENGVPHLFPVPKIKTP